ncbi:hypothetical protein ABVT39_023149 [Epinephelus coioides]
MRLAFEEQRWLLVTILPRRRDTRCDLLSQSGAHQPRRTRRCDPTLLLFLSDVKYDHQQSGDGYHSKPLSGKVNADNQPVRLLIAQLDFERHQCLLQCADECCDCIHSEFHVTSTGQIRFFYQAKFRFRKVNCGWIQAHYHLVESFSGPVQEILMENKRQHEQYHQKTFIIFTDKMTNTIWENIFLVESNCKCNEVDAGLYEGLFRDQPRRTRRCDPTLLLFLSDVKYDHQQSGDGYHSKPLSGKVNADNQPVRLLIAQLDFERHQCLLQCADECCDCIHSEFHVTSTGQIRFFYQAKFRFRLIPQTGTENLEMWLTDPPQL